METGEAGLGAAGRATAILAPGGRAVTDDGFFAPATGLATVLLLMGTVVVSLVVFWVVFFVFKAEADAALAVDFGASFFDAAIFLTVADFCGDLRGAAPLSVLFFAGAAFAVFCKDFLAVFLTAVFLIDEEAFGVEAVLRVDDFLRDSALVGI